MIGKNVLAFFAAHALPYLESVDGSIYQRLLLTSQGLGSFQVQH